MHEGLQGLFRILGFPDQIERNDTVFVRDRNGDQIADVRTQVLRDQEDADSCFCIKQSGFEICDFFSYLHVQISTLKQILMEV